VATDSLPHTSVSAVIDPVIRWIGLTASWLWLVLVLVIIFQVGQRYLFGVGSIAMEELQWHIYGVAYLLGLGFCLQVDRNVRIDALSERWSMRTRTWIETAGLLLFLLPFTVAVIIEAWELARVSWTLNEISQAPGGLPYRWAIKGAIVVGFVLLSLAAFSRLTRCTAYLFGVPKPLRHP
jgi:TRAP-type mannitol/chloroaromatic compound transport system permease small subunit